ncbi:DUF4417 domain-containing protein [Aerococcaceae bacterium 50-4]
MEIIQININELVPYSGNAKKHPEEQIKQIMASIEEFGNNDPIAIDENNIIIEGHGRYEALRQLGFEEVPVIRLDHLNKQQKRAYILAHNKLTMNTGFDIQTLADEMAAISDIDMGLFGFDDMEELEDLEDTSEDFEEDEEVFETDRQYLLHYADPERMTLGTQIPILEPTYYIPDEVMGFNYVLSDKDEEEQPGKLIHFYLDDYQFTRLWNQPELYIEKLQKYGAVLTPDFSLYMDMPLPMKMWNIYRSRLIGQIMQDKGLKVIPTLSWGGIDTFDFAFDGIPRHSTISVSTVGIVRDELAKTIWLDGMDYIMEYIQPSAIILYGNEIDYDFGKTKVYRFGNTNQERMREWADEAKQA